MKGNPVNSDSGQPLRHHPVKHLVLGTAGHIDHGKTALVKALTNVDTDRLPEEKARGITIELGFAAFDLPGGIHCSVIDVPGHERFVRTMVAGVGGIDLVMLVIAADEGIMPQTREHLDICRLLGVRSGVVALTKCDLVTAEWLDLITVEVRRFLTGTFMEAAPIVPLSSRTGAGIDLFRTELAAIARELEQKTSAGPFRLPVDRVFSLPGFGTVVTGTLLSGTVAPGDEAELLPASIPCRIRGIQTHGEKAVSGEAGSRLALNLHGVDHDQVRRGDVVVPRGVYRTTRVVDVSLHHLASAPRPLKNRASVRLHSATYDLPATVILLDRDLLEPGTTAYAQMRLSRPALLVHGDPFVLRMSSPPATIAGGRVLDPFPPGGRRRCRDLFELLGSLAAGSPGETISGMITGSRLSGITREELLARSGLTPNQLDGVLSALVTDGTAVQIVREPDKYLGRTAFASLCTTLLDTVTEFCAHHPLRKGIGKEELKMRLPARSDRRALTPCLAALEREGTVVVEHDLVRRAGTTDASGGCEPDISVRIREALEKGGTEPPFAGALSGLLGVPEKTVQEHLALLAGQGQVIKVKSDVYFSPEALTGIKEALVAHLAAHGSISLPEFRELTGLSRKFMIPVLEYFDSKKLTIRVGEKRILRRTG